MKTFLFSILVATGLAAGDARADAVWTLVDQSGMQIGTIEAVGYHGQYYIYHWPSASMADPDVWFYVEAAPLDDGDDIANGYYVLLHPDSPACPQGPATDHNGQQVVSWGYLQYWKEPQNENFQIQLGKCDGPLDETVRAVY